MTIQKTTIQVPEFTLAQDVSFTLPQYVPNFWERMERLLDKVPMVSLRGLIYTTALGSSLLAGAAVPQIVDRLIYTFNLW